jgi:MFS transporter, Spinster family, sphingosine-1-phosphate transporter
MKPQWGMVAILWVVALLNYLDRQVIFSLFPLLRSELSLSDTQLGLLGAVFLWTYAFFSPLAGWACNKFGHRGVIIGSIFAWSCVTAGTGFAWDFSSLAATRILMGATEAFYIPAALALIAATHPDSSRSRAIALHQSGIYVGIGGAGGGFTGEHLGWRPAFYLLGFVGLLYGGILRYQPVLRDVHPGENTFPDTAGWLRQTGQILNTPGYKAVMATFALVSLANWMVYTWLPLYLFDRFQLSLTAAGTSAAFLLQGPGLLGIAAGGWLADHFGPRMRRARVITQCGGLAIAAPFLFLSGWSASVLGLFAALVLYGFGRGIYDCNAMPVLSDLLPAGSLAAGYGFMNFAGTLMGGLASFAAGALRSQIGLDGAMKAASLIILAGAVTLLTVPARKPA